MTKNDKGHYSAKHPPEMIITPEITNGVAGRIADGVITCQAAFTVAAEYAVGPEMIGAAIDLQEARITKCQLGLFGHGSGPSPLKNAIRVNDKVKAAITVALVEGRLACNRAWQIADDLHLSRLEVARACESLNIRINQCQLGAF